MRMLAVILCAVLGGCAATLHGVQHTSGGAQTTATAGSVSLHATSSHARVSGAFGSAPPPGAGGLQVSASRGGSLLLLLGVIIAHALTPHGAGASAVPDERISETCSCYGWTPAAVEINK